MKILEKLLIAIGAYFLRILPGGSPTADRTLTLTLNDADRTVSLSGNLTVSAAATVSGTNTGDQATFAASALTGTQVSAYLGSNQNVTAGVWATVQLDTEVTDSGGEFNTTTHTFTPAATGTYLVDFRAASAASERIVASVWVGTSSEHKRLWDVDSAQFHGSMTIVDLTASTGYTFRVQCVGTDGTLESGSTKTTLQIRRLY